MPQRNQRGVTSSRDRSTRSSSKPISGAKPSNRSNRQQTSTARVTQGSSGRGTGNRGTGGRVTNASQRTTGTRANRVTGTPRPALPPGRPGGAIVRQETRPENPRRTSARSRQATSARGTTGPNRVGQPAGSANRMYGANVVNRSVRNAVNTSRAIGAGRVLLPIAIAAQAADVVSGFNRLANHPFLTGRRNRSSRSTAPASSYEKLYDTRAGRGNYGLDKPQARPTTSRRSSSTSTGSGSTAPRRSSGPSRPSTSNRPSSSSRPSSSRSSSSSRPSSSTRPSTPKPPAASTSGIGPVKSGDEYARKKGSLREQARKLREMQAESRKRQGK